MVKALILLIAALLVGCSSEDQPMTEGALHLRLVDIDDDSPIGNSAHVAADAWNEACGRTMIVFAEDGIPVRRVKSIPENPEWRGVYRPEGPQVDFMAVKPKEGQVILFAHEFGHALGLEHVKEARVMNEDTSSATPRPSAQDCNWSQIRYTGE